MEYIRITSQNIDEEDICCAMSNKQSIAKKEWMKQREEEGLVFYRSVERGKCFIEYLPIENAWNPIDAKDYLFINCLWVSGKLKGHGYSHDLLDECIKDAKIQNKQGICILSTIGRKKEFLADPKYLIYKGFRVADKAINDIALYYLPLKEDANRPQFKEQAKLGEIEEKGFVLYYSDQCPFTYYWVYRLVEYAKENGMEIKTHHITCKEEAKTINAPVSMYALFYNGKFITHAIQSDKKFMALAQKLMK